VKSAVRQVRWKMIREATHDDIPALVALQKAIEDENAIRGYQADSADDWSERDLTWTLVAVVGTRVIGFVYCAPRPYAGECVFPPGSRILEIADLLVAEPSRSQGLGHQLVGEIRRRAVEAGFTHLRVYSSARRFDDVVEFYRSCGFSPWYLEMTQEIGAGPAAAP